MAYPDEVWYVEVIVSVIVDPFTVTVAPWGMVYVPPEITEVIPAIVVV